MCVFSNSHLTTQLCNRTIKLTFEKNGTSPPLRGRLSADKNSQRKIYTDNMIVQIVGLKFNLLCTRTMRWLRLVGSWKLQVAFAEYRLFYRALLQKRLVILRSLLIVAFPYQAASLKNWDAVLLCAVADFMQVQPIAFRVSCNLSLQSPSLKSLFRGT